MNKTKFFSSLLVGLLVTTGLFTSCKDYDDDIKNLQQQIDQKSLKTDLEILRGATGYFGVYLEYQGGCFEG